jgi:uncharacterized protein (DUF58 family)
MMMKRTARFWSFLGAAGGFWFFGNQTQIGWLYVVSAVLGGILIAAWFLNRGVLKAFGAERKLSNASQDLHEGDEFTIQLELQNKASLPLAHLAIVENCPLAPPDSPEAELRMFIPSLQEKLSFDYGSIVHRRGLHSFPAMKLASSSPFGFYERHGEKAVETAVLVYPEVKKLASFELLDKQPAAELTNPRAGIGSEVIGIRPYRTGDSPRHIHWRSVAKRGELISKEFAEEIQRGVTVVIDRYCPIQPMPETKHQPFEMAIKCAVSMADYALEKHYPLYLAADSEGMAFPQGAIVWDALMQYTARVTARDVSKLADVLSYQALQQFVAVALAWPDESLLESFISLKHRGYNLFVALPDPASFPIGTEVSCEGMAAALERAGIAARVIKHGDDWAEILGKIGAAN